MAKILLFGVSTQKDRAVRVAAEKIGVDVTAVNRRDYGQKIGTLAEISGFHKNGKIYNGPDFAMEMLVFSGMDSQQVDVDRQFREGAEEALRIAKENGIDLAVLQSRSPSCGVKQIYDGNFTGKLILGQGVFAQLLEKNGFRVMDCEEI